MNFRVFDKVYMKDGTEGIVLYVYHTGEVAVIDVNDEMINVPISELSKERLIVEEGL